MALAELAVYATNGQLIEWKKPEGENAEYPFDAIVIFPYGTNLRENGQIRLSYYSAQAVKTGGVLYELKLAPKILIPGENVFGLDHTSTTDLMMRYLMNGHPNVAQNRIIPGRNLNNTAYQMDFVKKMQKEKNLQRLLIVALNWHDQRVALFAKNLGVKGAVVVEAEEVLAQLYGADRDKMLALPMTQELKKHDALLRKTMILDRRGWVQKALVQLKGPRVVDLRTNSYASVVAKR